MALPADRIKEALLHSDPDVRQAAAAFFAHAGQPDPSIMPLIVEAIDRFGWEHAFSCYWFLDKFPHTEITAQWLLDQLEQTNPEQDAERSDTLLSSLAHAPLPLLQDNKDRIFAIPWLDNWTRDSIEERLRLAAAPPEGLWSQLQELCQDHEDGGALDDDELEWTDQVIEVLGSLADQFGERVRGQLRHRTEDTGYWTLTMAVRLAGRMRQESSVADILESLSDEGEELVDACQDALVRIGGVHVVARLVDLFPSAGWDTRITIACMLEDFHIDQAVQGCLALARNETDVVIRGRLLQAVLLNFDVLGIEPARQFILETPLDPDVMEVRHALLTACALLEADFPELAAWREDAKEDEAARQHWHEVYGFDDDEEYEDDREEEPDVRPDVRPASRPDTYVNIDPRVGRNDPCPCGSGKKFKKCCLGKNGGRFGLQ